jgi:hypothetical protein
LIWAGCDLHTALALVWPLESDLPTGWADHELEVLVEIEAD